MTNKPTPASLTAQLQNKMVANSSGSTVSGTPVNSRSSYGAEFSTQTDVEKMKKANQQSADAKAKNSSYYSG